MNDGTNSSCFDNGPNHEENTGDRDSTRFDRKQMTDFVYGEPYGRQG